MFGAVPCFVPRCIDSDYNLITFNAIPQDRVEGELVAHQHRHGKDPLADGHARQDAIDEVRGELAHAPPAAVRYYSLVTFPDPEHISSLLKLSYDKLARVDGRNDSQVIFYDQVVPGGTLVGYLNADHWAVAVPIARRHPTVASTLVTRNAYPREALAEALLRFVEEDLD